MAALPNLETILLAIHEALGCPAPRKKQELKELRRTFTSHIQDLQLLLGDILAELGLDDAASLDAMDGFEEFFNFHKTLEIKTWAFGVELRQVLWHLVACVYAPGLARNVAFWQLATAMDQGMPGGEFWYLPQVVEGGSARHLRMPIAAVLDWLEELLGQPVHKATEAWPADGVDVESVKRTLAKWRDGDVPRRDNIERYFAEGTRFEFRCCLAIDDNATADEKLKVAKAFIRSKGLSADALRRQIPMPEPGRIEAVLSGVGSPEDAGYFLDLLKARYAQPTLRTIRRRLLLARAVQHGYIKLHQILCPGTSPNDVSPKVNKVLQLVAIYASVYHLTIQASRVSEDYSEQDAWFEQRLAPWDKDLLFLTILPSKLNESGLELAEKLTDRFVKLGPEAPLEDWVASAPEDLQALVQRRKQESLQKINELDELGRLQAALQEGSVPEVIETCGIYEVARAVAADPKMPQNWRSAAVQRAGALATNDAQMLDALLIELNFYVNPSDLSQLHEARATAQRILHDAESSPAARHRLPQILNARAKHHLRCNEFSEAEAAFDKALKASVSENCGDLPGLIARDAFALACAVKPNGFNVRNCERYWRLMRSFNVIEGGAASIEGAPRELEETAKELEAYFWEDLYRPYPGVAALARA